MNIKDEDIAYGKWQQRKIERDWDSVPSHLSPQICQKVGTVIPFSRTVDRDPNPRIPLSVGVEQPRWLEALAWTIVAAAVGLVYWGVS
jgi:hypothetical protein